MEQYIKKREHKLLSEPNMLKKTNIPIKYFEFLICILILITTIGYGATNGEMRISGEAIFRVVADVRITGLKFVSGINGGMEEYNSQYSKTGIITGISLPALDSSVTYEVTVTNISSVRVRLKDIIKENFNNPNMEYVLIGIGLEDTIQGMSEATFQIMFKYNADINIVPGNQVLDSRLELAFEEHVGKPPVITINDLDKYTIVSGTDMDLKSLVTITDEVDVDIESKLVISGIPSFNNTKGGEYTIKYNATNSFGAAANEVTITIYVIEFIKIAPGRYHTLALTADGYVYSWGHNDLRQLGDGTATNRLNPIKISNLSNIVDISAGYGSSYIVNNEGTVYSWGYGAYGQLGHGNTSNYSTPTEIASLAGEKVIKIDAGYHSVIALTEQGEVYTWGLNDYRQLGDGTTSVTSKSTPFKIALSGIKHVSIGYWHGMAATDTEVYAWGSNLEGQLGINGQSTTGVPSKVPLTVNIKGISAGGRHSLILTSEGDLYSFGYNSSGQAGLGNTITYIRTPELITTINDVSRADSGYDDSVAVTNDGKVYVWGANTYAKLGIGNTTTQRSPTLNTNLQNIRYVAAQYETIFYINSVGGRMYGAGYNLYGTLGNGTASSSSATTWRSIPSEVIFNSY